MKKVLALSLVAVLCLSVAALAGGGDKKSKDLKMGTVSKVDMDQKIFIVKDETGQEISINWDDSTKLEGTELKEGETVHFKANEKDGKMWATWIHVGEMKKM
jgi:cold shock CspA family protein